MVTIRSGKGPDTTPPKGARPWARVAGIAVHLGVVAILVGLRPEIIRGTFSSAESVLRVSALVAGFLLFSRLMRRVVSSSLVRTAVIAVPAALVLWLNVSPYLQDDVTIAGSYPESFTTAQETVTPPVAAAPVAPAPEAVDVPEPPPTPPQPVQLTAGRFRGLDGHRGSGEASVFRQPDGSHVVAFRDLTVSSVPDPVLYLVSGADQDRLEGATRLGRFDSSRDRYEIPPGTELEGPLTVLIWCQRFAVPVAGATQSPT